MLPRRILFFDGTKGRGCCKQYAYAVFTYDPPEGAGIRGTHRLPFIENRRITGQQGRVNNIGMPHHPTDVGSCPENLVGTHVVDVFHSPLKGHSMTAIVPNHPLGLPSSSGGIKDIKGVCCHHRHALMRHRGCHLCLPVKIAAGGHRGACLGTLEHNTEIRLVIRQRNRLIQQRFVLHHPARFDSAGCTDNRLGSGIIESHRKLVGSKTTKDDRVHSAQAGTGKHGDNGLRHHRHIHDNPISFTDTACCQNPCKGRDSVTQFRK